MLSKASSDLITLSESGGSSHRCLTFYSEALRGKLMGKFIDLTGQVFEYLTAVNRVAGTPGHAKWLCICVCGAERIVSATNLKTGHTKSCGCRPKAPHPVRENKSTKVPGYSSWAAMLKRCLDSKHENFKHYGAKGVTVAPCWVSDFQAFITYLGPKPTPSHTVDRIDNSKGYEPGNVRWATRLEQNINRKNTLVVMYRGVVSPLFTLPRHPSLTSSRVHTRVARDGWSVEKALTTPVNG